MKLSYIIIFTWLATSCSQPKKSLEVKTAGSLRDIMHKGKIDPVINLDSIASQNTYGLGAIEGLKGEVLLYNGSVITSSIIDSVEVIQKKSNTNASLFVYSKVSEWQTVPKTTGSDLEEILLATASEFELQDPFPFILKGSFDKLHYHIVDFDPLKDQLSNHKQDAFQSNLDNKEVIILGFYSTKHQGVFTHHDSNVHMHAMLSDESKMGHVDDLDIGQSSYTLLIPQL